MIKVYTKNACVACDRTKKLLTRIGVAYEEINVEEACHERDRLLAEGWQSMPVVKTPTTSWSGYQREKIQALA